MNVIIWARVSSREQREGYSIDAQLRANRDRATKNNWTVVREFVAAESAKRGAERLAFNEMFTWVKAHAKKDKIQAILSHKLDRVCRNMRDAVRLQELEDGCGIQLAFVENQFGPGAAGLLSFNVMAAVAQYYSDNLRNEVLKGIDEKARQGWPPGLAPFGYTNVPDKNEPVQPHPEESNALIRMFELFSSGKFTFETLRDQLAGEGHIYRQSQPRFHRTALSYILNNRIYLGEIARKGSVYEGKYKLLISRQTFDECQNILHGRNRRTGKPMIPLAGGILRCQNCGFAMTGEIIRRKLKSGGVRPHLYYRCANNRPGADHPTVRWTEDRLEEAIYNDLNTLKMPCKEIADWFRAGIDAVFTDTTEMVRTQRQTLAKRRTEIANKQDRLLNAYLGGTVDELTFQAKTSELKAELAKLEESLATANKYNDQAPKLARAVFDFSQNVAEMWRGSNSETKREILDCVSLNRVVGELTIDLPKRKPFDFLSEKPFLKKSRGDRI